MTTNLTDIVIDAIKNSTWVPSSGGVYPPEYKSPIEKYGLPIKTVPVTDDLPEEEQQQYLRREIQNIDGVDHACYYLKKLKWSVSVSEQSKLKTDQDMRDFKCSY